PSDRLGGPLFDCGQRGATMLLYLIVGAVLIFGCSLGVVVGYMWRDRIFRARRTRYLAERNRGDTQKAGYARRAIASGVDRPAADVVGAKLDDGGQTKNA